MSQADEAVVMAFLTALWRSDREGAKRSFAADAQWWFLPSLPYPRPMPARDAIDHVLDDMIFAFDGDTPLSVSVHAVMSNDAGEVAADYSASCLTRSGQPYENRYVLRATVRAGQIVEVRPYTDTQYLSRLFAE